MSQAGITYPIHIPQLKCNIESKPRQGAEIQNEVPKENIVTKCISLMVIDHWSSKKQCTMGTWKVDAETRGVYFLSMKYPKKRVLHTLYLDAVCRLVSFGIEWEKCSGAQEPCFESHNILLADKV